MQHFLPVCKRAQWKALVQHFGQHPSNTNSHFRKAILEQSLTQLQQSQLCTSLHHYNHIISHHSTALDLPSCIFQELHTRKAARASSAGPIHPSTAIRPSIKENLLDCQPLLHHPCAKQKSRISVSSSKMSGMQSSDPPACIPVEVQRNWW